MLKSAKGIIFITILVVLTVVAFNNIGGSETSDNDAVKAVQDNQSTNIEISNENYSLKNNYITEYGEAPFNVFSDGAMVIDFDSGEILYEKNPDMRLKTASISKIMTAIVVLENSKDLSKLVEVSELAASQIPNSADLEAGEKLSIEDLMYAMMMLSANDASWALAEGTLGLEDFVKSMNDRTKELGLTNTTFTNPAGFDDKNHKSTAYDMSVITRYAIKTYPDILKYMGEMERNIPKTDHNLPHYLYHVSSMIKTYPDMDGAKTGYTWEAGHTFTGTVKVNEKRLIVVTFNSQDAVNDINKLLDYGKKSLGKL